MPYYIEARLLHTKSLLCDLAAVQVCTTLARSGQFSLIQSPDASVSTHSTMHAVIAITSGHWTISESTVHSMSHLDGQNVWVKVKPRSGSISLCMRMAYLSAFRVHECKWPLCSKPVRTCDKMASDKRSTLGISTGLILASR